VFRSVHCWISFLLHWVVPYAFFKFTTPGGYRYRQTETEDQKKNIEFRISVALPTPDIPL
jgi:hypothetical protein